MIDSSDLCIYCGQPAGHLPVCPALDAVQAVPPQELAEVEDYEHKLGEAV